MKIDSFTHISPAKYEKALVKVGSRNSSAMREHARMAPAALSDVDIRFKLMDEFEDMMQVLTLILPPIEEVADPKEAVDLARIANDELAELVTRYPDRFVAVAALPMNNMDAALKEVDRAINDLKLRGVQIFSSINDKPLDSPEFLPLYEKMAQYDLPIWIHPVSEESAPYYPGEQGSKYGLAGIVGRPHATSMAMLRLACSGVLEKFPNLKFVTHHAGGTVPYLAQRIEVSLGGREDLPGSIPDYLRLFYNDTAVLGSTPNLMCAYAFCGADHLLFGTDFPMTPPSIVKDTIRSIGEMDISDSEKNNIYGENARRLLRLP